MTTPIKVEQVALHTEAQYLRFDPFTGDKDPLPVEFRRIRIVTTRKEHQCLPTWKTEGHTIPAGTRAWKETGKCDGRVASIFICMDCFRKLAHDDDGFCWVCVEHHRAEATA